MARKNILDFFFLCMIMFILAGCGSKITTTDEQTTNPLTEETTTESVLSLRLKAIYNLAVEEADFSGTYEEWLETVRGPEGIPGEDGREIELQVASGYIQWSYVGSSTWTNLVSLESLRGEDGTDGQQVLFRISSGYIQWQYSGDLTWTNLISIDLLIGENGKEVTFQVDGGYLQYQYAGDLIWTNLIELSSLIGPQGLPGQEIELRVNDTYLEWRYSGTEAWYFLYDLITLKGQDATFPVITISEDGYWVIDGVVQTQKAYTLEKYIVTFDATGGLMPGEYPLAIEVDKGNSLNLPIPTKAGYVFKGWVTGYTVNDVLFNNYLPITKNVMLFAEWEVDEQLLYDFFALVDQDHSFDYLMNVDFTNGVDTYFYDLDHFYYLNSTDTSPYDYLESFTNYDLPYIMFGSTLSSTYTQFDNSKGDFVSATSRNGSPWSFNRFTAFDEYDHFLSEVDPSLFTIRPTGLIYDYNGDLSYFQQPFLDVFSPFGIAITEAIIYTEQSCVLDLLNKTLTYYAVGSNDIPTVGLSTFVFSVVYQFHDLDVSTAIIPFDQMKQNVVQRFDLLVQQKYQDQYIDYVYPESLLGFDNLVLDKENLLDSILTLSDLVDFYLYDLDTIENYFFEYDYMLMYKDEIIDLMSEMLTYKSNDATADSITEMTAIYQQYETLILNLTEIEVQEDYGYIIYDEYVDLLNQAYVIDLEKLAFIKYRETLINSLGVFTYYLPITFVDYVELESYNKLVYDWMNNLRLQTTAESLNTSYQQAILEITSFPYIVSIPDEYIYYSSDEEYFWIVQLSYLAINPGNYEIYTYGIYQDLYLFTEMNPWALEAINLRNLSQEYLINDLLIVKTAELNNYVASLLPLVSDEDGIKLQSELNKLLLLLPNCLTVFDFLSLIDAFYENSDMIPSDQWKLAKIDAIDCLNDEYNYLILTASAYSNGLLTSDLADFNTNISALTYADFVGLDFLVSNTLEIFVLDYESALEYADLYLAKEEYQQKWEEFYLEGIPYVDLEAQPIDPLEDLYMSYRHEIRYSTAIVQAESFYNQGVETLIYLDYQFLPLYAYKESLYSIEENYVNGWLLTYYLSESWVINYLADFQYQLDFATSPYYMYYLYLDYSLLIDQQIIVDMEDHYQQILYDAYYDYQSALDSIYHYDLSMIYFDSSALLTTLTVWTDFQVVIDDFHLEVQGLVPTPWELEVEEAINKINGEYDYRMLTASAASQTLLTEDLDEFNLALSNLAIDDYTGLNYLLENTISNFNSDYETDPQFLEIYQAKMEYLQKWEEFYLVGIPYVNTEFSSLAELDDLYLNYRQSLRLMTTISGLESVYNQGVSVFSNLMFDYISITPLINEFLTSINSYVDAWELEYSLTSTSVDSLVNNFTVDIYGYPSPYAAYAYYLECREQIDIQILAYMVYHYQSLLDIAYNDYYVTIDPIYHMDLESIYYSHYNILETETVWANFQVIIDNFHIEVAALVNP